MTGKLPKSRAQHSSVEKNCPKTSLSSEDHLFGTTKIQSPTCPLHKIVILKIEVLLSLEYVPGSVILVFFYIIGDLVKL